MQDHSLIGDPSSREMIVDRRAVVDGCARQIAEGALICGTVVWLFTRLDRKDDRHNIRSHFCLHLPKIRQAVPVVQTFSSD